VVLGWYVTIYSYAKIYMASCRSPLDRPPHHAVTPFDLWMQL